MRAADLSAAQLQTLQVSLESKLAYLTKLRRRMEANRFPENDRLYRSIRISHELLREALMEIETLLSYRGFPTTPEPFR